MHNVTYRLTGISDYSQSKLILTPKKERETHQTHEERTWRERLHVDPSGNVVIPPMAINNVLCDTAKFLSIQIPGKGKATYNKHFEAGILCMTPAAVMVNGKPLRRDDVKSEWLHVPADGRRGGAKRVMKCFPIIPAGWTADCAITVIDDFITKDVLKLHLIRSGQFIGLGRFRPRNNGFYGRFTVDQIKWERISDDLDDMQEAA